MNIRHVISAMSLLMLTAVCFNTAMAEKIGVLMPTDNLQKRWFSHDGPVLKDELEKLGHINGLPEINHGRAAVAEIVAIFDGGRDDVDGALVAELLVGIDGDVKQTLAHAH